MPLYLNIFIEHVWTASIIPFSVQPTLYALKAFQPDHMLFPALIAWMGACVGYSLNWWLGVMLLRLTRRFPKRFHITESEYTKATDVFNRYLLFTLLFCWYQALNILPLAAGFLGLTFSRVIPLVAAGQAAFLIFQLSTITV